MDIRWEVAFGEPNGGADLETPSWRFDRVTLAKYGLPLQIRVSRSPASQREDMDEVSDENSRLHASLSLFRSSGKGGTSARESRRTT